MTQYNKTLWQDEIVDITDGKVIQQGTVFNERRANNIEDGIYRAHLRIDQNERDDKRRDISLEMLTRAPGSSGVFFDTFDGIESKKFVLDKARADLIEATVAGATVLKVDSVEGFKEFTQVVIFDDENMEAKQIMSINEGNQTVTVQTLSHGYKKGTKVARSTVSIDTVNKKQTVGTWDVYSVAVVEVV